MAEVTRKTYTNGRGPTPIDPNRHQTITQNVYPSVDMDAMTPFRIEWSGTRLRYEAIPSGGAGMVAGHVRELVHGWSMEKVVFAESLGPNANPIAVVTAGEFGNYSTKVTTVAMESWYLSSTTAGVLRDTSPYAGAQPIAIRLGYNSKLGEKVLVRTYYGVGA